MTEMRTIVDLLGEWLVRVTLSGATTRVKRWRPIGAENTTCRRRPSRGATRAGRIDSARYGSVKVARASMK